MSDKNAKQDWYLLFSVSSNLYAVGLPYVFRIIAIDQIHPMPETKEYVLGVIKVADAVWPVTDLRISEKGSQIRIPVGRPIIPTIQTVHGGCHKTIREAEDVRGDIAFAPSCLESGNFTFYGSAVTQGQNNFCGLGVTGKGASKWGLLKAIRINGTGGYGLATQK